MFNFLKRNKSKFFLQQKISGQWTDISIGYNKRGDATELLTAVCFDDDLDKTIQTDLYYNSLRVVERLGNKERVVV